MNSTLAAIVKSILPAAQWRLVRRATNRLRWLLKFRLMRMYGFPILQHPWVAAKYVLWDPEVESYTYELANESEYVAFIAPRLGVQPQQVRAWIDEARTDPYLTRDRGFRWSAKRRLPLGNRLMWYPIARALKPKLIVEAGVHEGLGSEMFLVALDRNASEGFPGRLISFDIHEDTGWLVHPDLRARWTRIIESTLTGMPKALQGLEVDLYIHETPHEPQIIGAELRCALRHAAQRLVVIDSSGLIQTVLRDQCVVHGGSHHFFLDQPKNHIVRSYGMGLAFFERSRIRLEALNDDSRQDVQNLHGNCGRASDGPLADAA
ncbi:class I SAM-dependent methyltransferase [Fontivita pretiosa]|uniref:class I SAM-dependent methyltransferase n=1 Tax=Fontivita pretiosa TaxID=2989684 RepID=UPI003D177E87